MDWLNYHHLRYFYVTAREGGLAAAGKALNVSHPTISTQIKLLEEALGVELFERRGRNLELTDTGKIAYRFADEIFSLGKEMADTLAERVPGGPVRLNVGATMVVPKLVVRRLLQPAFGLDEPVRLHCIENRHERLLAELASHTLDVVLADDPVPPGSNYRVFNHPLGESGVTFFAAPSLASGLIDGFPESLSGAPVLLPTTTTAVRRGLETWFASKKIVPDVVAEFEDAALMKVFAQRGLGAFPAPTIIEDDVVEQYGLKIIGHVSEVVERFFAITAERKIKNPAVVAICESARADLRGGSTDL